jgi:soluble lytic murein transglycosylase-like protein
VSGKVQHRAKFAVAACAAALGATGVAQAAAPQLSVVDVPEQRLQRSIELHREQNRYRDLLEKARKLDAAPKPALVGAGAGPAKLEAANETLRKRIERAKSEPQFGLAPGVSQATLDAIAACESGGDPTAVNAAGYYGKYQFDTGTWASVGGSGNPAAASEAEQDYRASLLYARAGSSPWPVCGV